MSTHSFTRRSYAADRSSNGSPSSRLDSKGWLLEKQVSDDDVLVVVVDDDTIGMTKNMDQKHDVFVERRVTFEAPVSAGLLKQ